MIAGIAFSASLAAMFTYALPVMPAAAEVRCAGCGTTVIVLPSTLFGLVPAEVEPDFLSHARELRTEEGKRFAVADDVGAFTCPSCEYASLVPVVDFN